MTGSSATADGTGKLPPASTQWSFAVHTAKHFALISFILVRRVLGPRDRRALAPAASIIGNIAMRLTPLALTPTNGTAIAASIGAQPAQPAPPADFHPDLRAIARVPNSDGVTDTLTPPGGFGTRHPSSETASNTRSLSPARPRRQARGQPECVGTIE